MGRGKRSGKGGCMICSSQKKIWRENKKRRLTIKREIKQELKQLGQLR